MFVARVLTPEEIGIFAIVAAIGMSSSEFKLLGTGDYLIREKIDKEKVRSTLGLAIISSWAIAILMISFAGVISRFYEQEDIQYLLYLISIPFWLAPFSSTNFALLRKEFRYVKNTTIGWTSRLGQFGVSIVLILYGYSYFGLAIGIAAGAIFEFLLTLFLRANQMSFVPHFRSIKPILKFGTINTFTNLLIQQTKLSYDLIIGKIGSAADVAIYSKGNGLVDFIGHLTLGGLQNVALPYLSSENGSMANLKTAYLKASRLALSMLLPILVSAAILKYELILLLFGSQWGAAVPLVTYVSIWYLLCNFHPFARQALISRNYEKHFLAIQIINIMLIVSNIFISYKHGLIAISQGLIVVGVVYFILITLTLNFAIGLSFFEYVANQFKNITLTLGCACIAYLLQSLMKGNCSELLIIIGAGVCLSITWILLTFAIKHEISDEIKKLFGKG